MGAQIMDLSKPGHQFLKHRINQPMPASAESIQSPKTWNLIEGIKVSQYRIPVEGAMKGFF